MLTPRLSGGIGITAFLAHVDVYSQINFNYTLHYAVRSTEDIPFKPLIEKMGSNVTIYDKSKDERMNILQILKDRTWNSFVYACGPQRMIDDVVRCSKECGMSQDEVHYEAFQIATSGDPFMVEIKKSGKMLMVEEEKTLLQTIRESGLEVDSSCEAGNCGTCRVEVCEGKVDHRGSGLGEEDKATAMLSCVSRGIGRIVIDF
jgi:ferredoxin